LSAVCEDWPRFKGPLFGGIVGRFDDFRTLLQATLDSPINRAYVACEPTDRLVG
jgi:hypothetical protein